MKNFHIAGHLGADPELDTKGETTWTRLRVAANGRQTDWFDVAVFGALAETCCEHLKKGDGVAVNGNLRTSKYEDRTVVNLIAQSVQFFGKGQRQ